MDHWWDNHVIHPCTSARNGRAYLTELEGTNLQPFPQGMGQGRAASSKPAGGGNRAAKRNRSGTQAQAQGDPNRLRLWDARPKQEPNKGWGKGGGKGGQGGRGKGGHGGWMPRCASLLSCYEGGNYQGFEAKAAEYKAGSYTLRQRLGSNSLPVRFSA